MIAKTNRRDFLGRSTILPLLAASVIGLEGQPLPAAEPIKRAGGPRLKISLNAYSFSKALNDGMAGNGQGMTLFELLDFRQTRFRRHRSNRIFLPGLSESASGRVRQQF